MTVKAVISQCTRRAEWARWARAGDRRCEWGFASEGRRQGSPTGNGAYAVSEHRTPTRRFRALLSSPSRSPGSALLESVPSRPLPSTTALTRRLRKPSVSSQCWTTRRGQQTATRRRASTSRSTRSGAAGGTSRAEPRIVSRRVVRARDGDAASSSYLLPRVATASISPGSRARR